VAACYLENNIRLTGLDEHLKGREMAWIRLEPYFGGDGRLEFLPMLCQHCDHAPCEAVCPVLATYHNPEGLNAQVYNRCVGTRYCANNCPYKVRRFNWLDEPLPEPLPKMTNPDLSRRPAGVMEKCTFCIQRIVGAKDQAKDKGQKVRDGDLTTACAQTCPTGAITFGNLLDPASAVSKQAASPRAYRVLESLGTRPAVYYLKTVRSSEFGVRSSEFRPRKLETRNSKLETGGGEP
jgi:Fe-S-cluster-containing dehydrogenase component